MKRTFVSVFAVVALLAAGTSAAHAQGLNFGLGGGLTMPLGDFNTADKLGWHGLALVGYQPAGNVGGRVDFMYGQHKHDGVSGKTKLAGGLVNLVYNFGGAGSVKPYAIGGAGLYNVKIEVGSASADETKFAAGGGLGLKFKAGSDANFFVEGRFVNVFTSGSSTNFIPVTFGISFATH